MSYGKLVSVKLKRFGRFAGLDAQVISTLLLRGWMIIAGGVMVLFVPIWLSGKEQGYYFTFSSLLALQIFFELGMGQVIVQLVGHEFAYVNMSQAKEFEGSASHIARLSSLVGLLRRWYRISATVFLVVVSICGLAFFSANPELPFLVWAFPWLLLTAATALNLYFSSMLTVLEGCGEVSLVARLRLVQSVLGYGLLWAALYAGAGLLATTLVPVVAAIYSFNWLKNKDLIVNKLLASPVIEIDSKAFNWYRDVFPFQWRIAVSWVSGYFIFQLFTPLAFAKLGAVEAGRLGLSLAVFTGLLSVGMSWINAKVPAMAAYVARNERAALNRLFCATLLRSMIFTLLAVMLIVAMLMAFSGSGLEVITRVASVPVVSCLALVTLSNCFIFAAAAYMRAHKEEPMMSVSVVAGLCTLGAVVFGARIDAFAMVIGYALVNTCIALPWTMFLFFRYYRRP